jgi:hypothetical protein
MEPDKLYKLLKFVANFTAKNDQARTRDFLNYIHVEHDNDKTILFASTGHIAVKVIVPETLVLPSAISTRLNFGIKEAEDFDKSKPKAILDVFKREIEFATTGSFDARLLRKVFNAIGSFASSKFIDSRKTKIDIGSKTHPSLIFLKHDDIEILAAIMPMRQ